MTKRVAIVLSLPLWLPLMCAAVLIWLFVELALIALAFIGGARSRPARWPDEWTDCVFGPVERLERWAAKDRL